MPEPTPSQRMLIEDGLPESIATMTPEQRRAAWKGVRVKPTAAFNIDEQKKTEDPGTIALLAEIAAKAKAEAKARKLAKREAAAFRDRQKPKPEAAVAASQTETDDMSRKQKKAKPVKTSKAAQIRALRERNAAKRKSRAAKPAKAAKPKSPAKAASRAKPARTPATAPATAKSGRVDQAVVLMQRAEGATSQQIADAIGILEPSARALISKVATDHKVDKAKRDGGKTVYTIAA